LAKGARRDQHVRASRGQTEVSCVDSPATYLSWGFILISIPNLLMIIGMIVLFIVALVAPFPHGTDEKGAKERRDD
jgi:hypothetical protein